MRYANGKEGDSVELRLRKKRWAKPELEKDFKVIFTPSEMKGKWQEIFNNNYPINLELGCGRGNYIAQLAAENRDINFIVIDTHPELLVYVLRKLNERNLTNVRIIPMNIEDIEDVFGQDEINKIYINFCNPWPSNRHHKRRLTHPNFLNKYKTFLRKGSEIWFKTDDENLFEDSLRYFTGTGYNELTKTYDLAQSNIERNIMTEYEEKFISQGIRIKFAKFQY